MASRSHRHEGVQGHPCTLQSWAGTKPTIDNYARDAAAYLMWAAEPKLEERHKLGARVMIYLIAFAVIMFLAKRTVWARLHRKVAHTA